MLKCQDKIKKKTAHIEFLSKSILKIDFIQVAGIHMYK